MIKFNNKYSFELAPDKSLLQLAIDKDIPLNHSCGGFGTCGTCRVIINNHAELPKRNLVEQVIADDRDFNDNERLACQTLCDRPLQVDTPSNN